MASRLGFAVFCAPRRPQPFADRRVPVSGFRDPLLPEHTPTCNAVLYNRGDVVVTQVIAASRRPFFHFYDVVSGKVHRVSGIQGRSEKSFERFCVSPDGDHVAFYGNDGTAILVSARTKQWLANLKMPGALRSLSFTSEGDLLAGCDDGMVHRWDARTRRCLWRFHDEGSTSVNTIVAAPSGQLIATGYGRKGRVGRGGGADVTNVAGPAGSVRERVAAQLTALMAGHCGRSG